MALSVEIVPTPSEEEQDISETQLRDINDRPILRAAMAAKVDVFVTGDKDFLEAEIDRPAMLSAAEFLEGN